MGNSIPVIKESYSGLATEKQSECYFKILPKRSYTEGLKKCAKLKLWDKQISLNQNWAYNLHGEDLIVVDLEKYRENQFSQESEPVYDQNGDTIIADYQIDVPNDIAAFLKSKLNFIKEYGFDPSSKDEVYLVHEAKQFIESNLGIELADLIF